MTVIGFVPARGGSVRIPRKNLRAVHGIPLVARTVLTLKTAGVERVIVSTDDAEIADVAALWGAEIDVRPVALCGPDVTIDQVVDEWLVRACEFDESYEDPWWVVVAQPTSPLLSPPTVHEAIRYAHQSGVNVFTTIGDRGLLWTESTTPLFDRRVNSTALAEPQYYRETGGLVVFDACHRQPGDVWPPMPRSMAVLDAAEAIDIDDYADLARARGGAKPARIQLRYVESHEIGSGHRRRCETLAAELMGRHMVEVVEHTKAPLPSTYDIAAYGDTVLASHVDADLVVLDILDTKVQDVQGLYDAGVEHVVTLEDLGLGTSLASCTINELYSPSKTLAAARCGPRWAVLRPEFQGHLFRERTYDERATVVVSFGGTDPTHMTEKVVAELASIEGVKELRVLIPPGRDTTLGLPEALTSGMKLTTVRNPHMAREFLTADLAITSSGRTVHEAAACGCPVIAVPVNERERLHDVCPGVTYIDADRLPAVVAAVKHAISHPEQANDLARKAYEAVDGLGVQRIAYVIDGLLGGML